MQADLAVIAVAFDVLAAIITLALMQIATGGNVGWFCDRMAIIKTGHRLLFAAVAAAFMIDAGDIIVNHTQPRAAGIMVHVVLFVALAISATRHQLNRKTA